MMVTRKGAGRGTGKGYKNLRSFPRDSSIHSQSARGRKQPQKIPMFEKINPLIARYNKSKDKDLLPNKGLERTRIILKSDNVNIGKFIDENSGMEKSINLNFKIEERDLSTQAIYNGQGELLYIGNTEMTQDGRNVTKYKILSISGSIGTGSGAISVGQIDDELRNNINDSNYSFKNKEAVKEILEIWDKYHLNDLKAGTKKQEAELERVGLRKAEDYSKAVTHLKKKGMNPDKGYMYGTKWLVDDLPEDIADKLSSAIMRARQRR